MKRTPLRKISKVINLKRKTWDIFSKWIRERDKRCITCGSTNDLQAGHFYHACLDFDEINIHAQCKKCNHYLSGNLAVYANYLLSRYGLEEFNKLNERHWLAMRGEKRSDEDYLALIEKYK